MDSAADTSSLIHGLRALTTIAQRGPLGPERLARLNGWGQGHAARLLDVLEGHGLVRRDEDRLRYAVTPIARRLIEPVSPADLH